MLIAMVLEVAVVAMALWLAVAMFHWMAVAMALGLAVAMLLAAPLLDVVMVVNPVVVLVPRVFGPHGFWSPW